MVYPSKSLSTTQPFTLNAHPTGRGRELGKNNKAEFMSSDKNYSLRRGRGKNDNSSCNFIHILKRDAQAIAHYPPIDVQTVPSQQQSTWPIPTMFQDFSHAVMIWSILLASLGQLYWFCLLSTTCAFSAPISSRTVQEAKKLKFPYLCTALLNNSENIGLLLTLFSLLKQKHIIKPNTMKEK